MSHPIRKTQLAVALLAAACAVLAALVLPGGQEARASSAQAEAPLSPRAVACG